MIIKNALSCLLAMLIAQYCIVFSLFTQKPFYLSKPDYFHLLRYPLFQSIISNDYKLTHTYSLNIPNPSYVQILQQGILSVTSFSFLKKGSINQINLNDKLKTASTLNGEYLWPNELTKFETIQGDQFLIIPDGFLFPGQNDGGLFCIRNPNNITSKPFRITSHKPGWFYHRVIHVDLPGRYGRSGILTARAHKPLFGRGQGELVWIHLPDDITNETKVWEETVLVNGPDVMFETLDLNPFDDCIEVIAAQFFGQQISVHSLCAIDVSPFIRISDTYILDTIGQPYGLCLASFPDSLKPLKPVPSNKKVSEFSDGNEFEFGVDILPQKSFSKHSKYSPNPNVGFLKRKPNSRYSSITRNTQLYVHSPLQKSAFSKTKNGAKSKGNSSNKYLNTTVYIYDRDILNNDILKENSYSNISTKSHRSQSTHLLVTTHECSYDLWSTAKMLWSVITGRYPRIRHGSSVAHEYGSVNTSRTPAGGSLFAYDLPTRYLSPLSKIRSEDEVKSEVKSEVEATIEDRKLDWKRHILSSGFKVRGWGGLFAPGAPGLPYVFHLPSTETKPVMPLILLAGDCTGSAYIFTPRQPVPDTGPHTPTYDLAFEVECGATVGSAAVTCKGAKAVEIFLPSYELNQVHAFRLEPMTFL